MKYYCASPFFNDEQIRIRDDMVSKINEEDQSAEIFRPDLTESSRAYDKSPGLELGKKIYDDNVEHIDSSEVLVFPKGTNDVGTLFEVGIAMKLGKKMMRYDQVSDLIENVEFLPDMKSFGKDTLVAVEDVSSAVLLGYNYDTKYHVYYVLGLDVSDNLMLRFMATRVEFDSKTKKFVVHEYDIKEAA